MDETMIEWLEDKVQGRLRPDLTLLLDAPIDIGMGRAKNRGQLDRFESEQLCFFDRVRNAYLKQAQQHPQQIKVINADQPLNKVQEDIRLVIQTLLNNK